MPSPIKLGTLQVTEVFILYEIPDDQDGRKLMMSITQIFLKISKDSDPIIRLAAIETVIYFLLTSVNIKIAMSLRKEFQTSLSFFANGNRENFSENSYLQNMCRKFRHNCETTVIKPIYINIVSNESGDEEENDAISSCLKVINDNLNILQEKSLTIAHKSELNDIKSVIDCLMVKK